MTIDCIRSILDQMQGHAAQLIVIDNASSDRSAELVREQFPDVELIISEKNIGFARANNLAAAKSSGEHLLFLNPDTIVLDQAVDKLLAFARRRPNAKIWGGRTVFLNGALNPTSSWRFMTIWSILSQAIGLSRAFSNNWLLNWEGYGGWNRDTEREVDIVSGCFLLIERSFWNRLEGFDPSFFMYAEEADLCYRARAIGARPMFTPEATIVHYGGASEHIRSDKIVRLYKAKIHFIQKHWSGPARWIGPFLIHLNVVVRSVVYRAAAALSRREHLDASAKEWTEVLLRSKEWSSG